MKYHCDVTGCWLRLKQWLSLVVLACVLSLHSTSAQATWIKPVPGRIFRSFVTHSNRFQAGQHRGVDLQAGTGVPVRAACTGVVQFAGRTPKFGVALTTLCRSLRVTYTHLAFVNTARGQTVSAGRKIGKVGRSGFSETGRSHLHFSVRMKDGVYLDPLLFLPADHHTPHDQHHRWVLPDPYEAPQGRIVMPQFQPIAGRLSWRLSTSLVHDGNWLFSATTYVLLVSVLLFSICVACYLFSIQRYVNRLFRQRTPASGDLKRSYLTQPVEG